MDIRSLKVEATELAAIAKNGELTAEQQVRFDEVLSAVENHKAQADKAARAVSLTADAVETNAAPEAPASVGAAFIRATEGSTRTRTQPVDIDTRALITSASIYAAPTVVQVGPAPVRTPLANLVNIENVANGSVDTVVETVDYNAAVVAEGALKPETEITFTSTSFVLDTIANYTDVTRQALQDEGRLEGIINGTLINGVARKSEQQIALAITGNVSIATAEGATLLEAIRFAISDVESNGYTPTAILINPRDLATLDVSVANIFRSVTQNSTVWGLTVVTSSDIAEGTAYVGDFASAVTWFQVGTVSVYTTDADADKFRRNIITILAETRAKAVVVRPAAIVKAVALPLAP